MKKVTFGSFLSERRKAQGHTQKDLARAAKVSDSLISRWETGARKPRVGHREALISIGDYLKMDDGEKNRLLRLAQFDPLQPEEVDVDRELAEVGPERWRKSYFLHKWRRWSIEQIARKLGVMSYLDIKADIAKGEAEERVIRARSGLQPFAQTWVNLLSRYSLAGVLWSDLHVILNEVKLDQIADKETRELVEQTMSRHFPPSELSAVPPAPLEQDPLYHGLINAFPGSSSWDVYRTWKQQFTRLLEVFFEWRREVLEIAGNLWASSGEEPLMSVKTRLSTKLWSRWLGYGLLLRGIQERPVAAVDPRWAESIHELSELRSTAYMQYKSVVYHQIRRESKPGVVLLPGDWLGMETDSSSSLVDTVWKDANALRVVKRTKALLDEQAKLWSAHDTLVDELRKLERLLLQGDSRNEHRT
jgi:transcriptional regulator with XRE-family HTH domain